jgi:hypothetical protein
MEATRLSPAAVVIVIAVYVGRVIKGLHLPIMSLNFSHINYSINQVNATNGHHN